MSFAAWGLPPLGVIRPGPRATSLWNGDAPAVTGRRKGTGAITVTEHGELLGCGLETARAVGYALAGAACPKTDRPSCRGVRRLAVPRAPTAKDRTP